MAVGNKRSGTGNGPFRLCLNTSTIRGQKLGLVKELELASAAGYDSVEPWIRGIEDYRRGGGSLPELRRRIGDLGLTVESAIGFAEWIVDDPAQRAKGLEEARRDMDLLAAIGGKRLACPPIGATEGRVIDLLTVAERYRALLDVAAQTGVAAQLELWGFSVNLHRLGEVAFAATEAAHPGACMLLDVYHLYRGGSDSTGLALFGSQAVQVLHMNDYPASPAREELTDAHRVFPGDGVAPIPQMLRDLSRDGGELVLSLELFSREYWERPADEVVREGLAKMKAIVAQATQG